MSPTQKVVLVRTSVPKCGLRLVLDAVGVASSSMFAPSRAAAGGLIAYGTSQVAAIRRMAADVEKILKGAKPGELSVETVTRYELIVNLKTAREIGVTIPPEVLKRADQIKLVADSAQRPVQLDDPHIQSGRESIEPGDAL